MLGFAVPQYGQAAHAELARFAATAEELGADSLWVGDRLLAAVQPSVGYQGEDTIPKQFRTGIDPFIALAVTATDTSIGPVADALRLLADNGYPDAFVDLLYVTTGTDSHLAWVEGLLAA